MGRLFDRQCSCRWAATLCLALVMAASATNATANSWVEVTGPHFRVVSNQKVRHARRVVKDLEQMRQLYVEGLHRTVSDPFRPVTVVLVNGGNDLASWLPQFSDGPRPGGAFFTGPFAHYMIVRLDDGRQTVYHEYLHLMTALNVGHIPGWLSEGLAEFYANTEFVGSAAKFGQPNKKNLAYLRGRRRLPLAELLGRSDNPHATGDPEIVRMFYALSWALTHYLLLGRDELVPGSAVSAYCERAERRREGRGVRTRNWAPGKRRA